MRLLIVLIMTVLISTFVCGQCGVASSNERSLAQHTRRQCFPEPGVELLECSCKAFKCKELDVLRHHCLSCEVAKATYHDLMDSDPSDVRLKYAKMQDFNRAPPPALTQKAWRELWVAHFATKYELSASNAQELLDFTQYCTGEGEEKLVKYRTILDRIRKKREYPTASISDLLEYTHVFQGVPKRWGGDENGEVIFRFVVL